MAHQRERLSFGGILIELLQVLCNARGAETEDCRSDIIQETGSDKSMHRRMHYAGISQSLFAWNQEDWIGW
jgi:hypothetical protein